MCFFLKNFEIFLNSASSAAALVFYLPGVCTHTDAEKEKGQSPEYFKISGKKHNILWTPCITLLKKYCCTFDQKQKFYWGKYKILSFQIKKPIKIYITRWNVRFPSEQTFTQEPRPNMNCNIVFLAYAMMHSKMLQSSPSLDFFHRSNHNLLYENIISIIICCY